MTSKFCHRCKQAVMPSDESCIIAERNFHTKCFNCIRCDTSIVGIEFYTIGGIDCVIENTKNTQKLF